MKRLLKMAMVAALIVTATTSQAQLVEGKRGYEDFKIGVAGYSYRKFNIDQTLAFLKSMEVKYFSVKDWWLPLNSTKEQMDAFKAKCAEAGALGLEVLVGDAVVSDERISHNNCLICVCRVRNDLLITDYCGIVYEFAYALDICAESIAGIYIAVFKD